MYRTEEAKKAIDILKNLGTPCLIHQPSYSMLNRWIEDELEADCLLEEEYKVVYEALSDLEIALLLSLTVADSFGIISSDDDEKEWKIALDRYLMMQKGNRRLRILELAKLVEREHD